MAEEIKKKKSEKLNTTAKVIDAKPASNVIDVKKPKVAIKAEVKVPVVGIKAEVKVPVVETLGNGKKKTTALERKKIMFVASEALPFIASGGLGEVIGSLPIALANNLAYDIRVVMPLYSIIAEKYKHDFEYVGNTQITMAWRSQYCGVFKYVYNGVTFYFIDNEYYFKRSGIYGYLDEAERYTFMSKAALDIIPMIGFIPQIIHCHDWQSALIPVYLKTNYKDIDMYKNIRTVFTIHNMEYQGRYGSDLLYDLFDLPEYSRSLLEYLGDINLMKGAIQCADIVSTVSPSYAKEILDPIASCGLHFINQQNSYKMRGILNGIDVVGYDAKTDKAIPFNFDVNSLEIKAKNKTDLQQALGLPVNENVPMIAMISRLVSHKGIDLVKEMMEEMLQKDIQFVILGTGDYTYEDYYKLIEKKYNNKVRALIEFNGGLSRKIYAAADIFLMPSKNEPCGLSQMICTRYATIPVVRHVGGLGDSIIDNGNGIGNGYTFYDYNGRHMLDSIERCLVLYNDKVKWKELMTRAMTTDFSWAKSAEKYLVMYDDLLNGKI